MYPWPPTFCLCFCCCLYTSVVQEQKLVCPWLSIFSCKPKWGGSRSWCTPGHLSFAFVFVVVYTPLWDSSKSWCALGCPSFLVSLNGVVEGVGVPLATYLLFLFLLLVVYTPTWDSSKSWCALGCPSFLVSLNGVVAGVGVLLATYLLFCFCCCLYTYMGQYQKLLCPSLAVHLFL